jgi:photosystem II stability/assembly factor-like uncharacterized protein
MYAASRGVAFDFFSARKDPSYMAQTFSETSNVCRYKRPSLVAIYRIFIIIVFLSYVIADSAEQVTEYSILSPLASKSLLLDVAASDGHFVVVGERGHILVADRPEGPWRQSRVPTRVTLTAVYFHDRSLGWAVGHDAVVLRTVDGGRSWKRVHAAPAEEIPLLDVWFRDDQYGIAVGAHGLYLSSSNSGLNWTRSELNLLGESSESKSVHHSSDIMKNQSSSQEDDVSDAYDVHLNSIVRASSGSLYIAAEAGRLYRSDDEGLSWVSLNSPYRGSFFGILPLPCERLLAYGLRGNVFLSEDSGGEWQRVLTPTRELLTDGLLTSDGKIIIVGQGGTLLISDDYGRKFSLAQQASRKGYSAVIRTKTQELLLVGEMGVETLYTSDSASRGMH